MVKGLLSEYIRSRMDKLKYGTDYYIEFRHLVMKASEVREIEAFNDLYVLAEAVSKINIRSDFGVFDLEYEGIDELQYTHSGTIRIENTSDDYTHVQFIQVIPILKAAR
ncbi:MAG: hypothetical protein ACJ77K_06435 [Bacteroidia bacterium]